MNVRSLVIGAALALASTVALAAGNPISATASSDSGTFIAATLCSAGSFECQVSPSYTRLSAARRATVVALRKGTITVAQAQSFQDTADRVRSLLDHSLAACAQDNRTGKCTGDARKASALLSQAKALLK